MHPITNKSILCTKEHHNLILEETSILASAKLKQNLKQQKQLILQGQKERQQEFAAPPRE
jgi:hypothetical protein